MTQPTEWITKREAAARAGVIVRTIDNWLAAGRLTKHRDGVGHVRIDAAELTRLITPRPVAVISPNR